RRRQGFNLVIQSRQKNGAVVDLYRIPADGGPMKNLTVDWDFIPETPSWSANGEYVYFIGDVGGDRHPFRMPSGGGHVDRLTQGERTLAGFSFSRAFDRMAYTAADPIHPAETYAARID